MLIRPATFAVLVLAGVLVAAPQPDKKPHLDPHGEPKGLVAGHPRSYFVWHDAHGWHLRSTTEKVKHQFKGHIEVEGGTIEKIHSYKLEKTGELADQWKLDSSKHGVKFDFETDGGIDGINFHVSKDAKSIRFKLLIDGKEQTEHIHIGRAGHHPKDNPFTLPAHPGKR